MATSVLNPTTLNFKLNGGNTASSLTASTNSIEFNGHSNAPVQLRNVASPSIGSDAVTKTYVDGIKATLESSVNGLSWKSSATCATTSALPASAYNSTSHYLEASANGPMPTQDGITLSLNDRILIKDQTDGTQNGIYTVTSVGGASSKWKVTRTADANSNTELQSAACFIDQGSVSANKAYIQTADAINADLVTTLLSYVNFSSSNLTGDASTIQISGSTVSVLPFSITSNQLSTNAVTNAKMADNSVATVNIADSNVTDDKILTMSATKLTGSISADRIANGSITDLKIAGMNADKLTGTMDPARIGPNSINNERISDLATNKLTGTISASQMATANFTSGLLHTGSAVQLDADDVTIEISGTNKVRVKDASISSSKIIDSNVTTNKIADDAITGGKLANDIAITTTAAITANSFTASSDRRLKENIEAIDEPLDKVLAMEGVTYNFKTNKGTRRSGVIAQDLEVICPELVQADEKGMRSVNYIDLIPYLIEAIKELKDKIDEK